jgi:hypothetical protein
MSESMLIINAAINTGIITEEKMSFNENLPIALTEIYQTIGYSKGLILGDWNIMSPMASSEFNNEYKLHGCNTLYSFAYKYSGMGWIYLATVDLTNGKVFIRHDGGSNGYDTQLNLKKTLSYRDNFDIENYHDKLIDMEKFLTICMNHDEIYQLLLW